MGPPYIRQFGKTDSTFDFVGQKMQIAPSTSAHLEIAHILLEQHLLYTSSVSQQ